MSGRTVSFESLGTGWTITLQEPVVATDALRSAVLDRLDRFDATYSRFRPDSLVAAMAACAGTYRLPDEAEPLLGLYALLYALTDGAFTPLIGDSLSDAGYDSAYSLQERQGIRRPPAWEDALSYDHPLLTVRQPVTLDFGAAGKGYAADLVAETLRLHGASRFTVDAGGDIVHAGTEPLPIALEDPLDETRAVGTALLAPGRSLCASSPARRSWGRFHHILDPAALASPAVVAATWAVADSALVADGVSTALFLADPALLQGYVPFEYLILYADRSAVSSPGFPGTVFA